MIRYREMGIRRATEADAQAISSLIVPLAEKFIANDFSDEARRNLLDSMSVASVRQNFQKGLRYHVYEEHGRLLGAVATREDRHLFNLFVAELEQGRGIARQLWEAARQACFEAGADGTFTVNASSYAVGMYEKFGFERDGNAISKDGVVVIPMRIPNSSLLHCGP